MMEKRVGFCSHFCLGSSDPCRAHHFVSLNIPVILALRDAWVAWIWLCACLRPLWSPARPVYYPTTSWCSPPQLSGLLHPSDQILEFPDLEILHLNTKCPKAVPLSWPITWQFKGTVIKEIYIHLTKISSITPAKKRNTKKFSFST